MTDGDRRRTPTGAGLAELLADLARDLHRKRTLADTLDGIVHGAVRDVPGAAMAAISSVEGRRRIETTAGTDPTVYRVDQAQYRTGQGPGLTSIYEEDTVRAPDLVADARWPAFAAEVRDLGVGSMLSFQLYVDDANLGALNLYHSEPHAFDDESEQVGRLFAGHAAVAMDGSRDREQLVAALSTRDLIGQAKGILMERHRLDADQAFELLVRASQVAHCKLRDVAEQLAFSGELPGAPDDTCGPVRNG